MQERGKREIPLKKTCPTSGIIRQDSHLRKSGSDPANRSATTAPPTIGRWENDCTQCEFRASRRVISTNELLALRHTRPLLPISQGQGQGQGRHYLQVLEAEIAVQVQEVVVGEWSIATIQRRGKREIPEKTRRPAPSSGTICTCKHPGVAGRGLNPARLDLVEINAHICVHNAHCYAPQHGLRLETRRMRSSVIETLHHEDVQRWGRAFRRDTIKLPPTACPSGAHSLVGCGCEGQYNSIHVRSHHFVSSAHKLTKMWGARPTSAKTFPRVGGLYLPPYCLSLYIRVGKREFTRALKVSAMSGRRILLSSRCMMTDFADEIMLSTMPAKKPQKTIVDEMCAAGHTDSLELLGVSSVTHLHWDWLLAEQKVRLPLQSVVEEAHSSEFCEIKPDIPQSYHRQQPILTGIQRKTVNCCIRRPRWGNVERGREERPRDSRSSVEDVITNFANSFEDKLDFEHMYI
ncbi:hypothetical protein PR048_027182 [Dryococelus australis]|uniref:Uncharacterized protein n=1 Tax=Dryococelus australis TaxID=614101 RepID=A0ABQ9GG64_9NEOP|nr:hypothetical protein PR048_027182 [Dryococelus australis]